MQVGLSVEKAGSRAATADSHYDFMVMNVDCNVILSVLCICLAQLLHSVFGGSAVAPASSWIALGVGVS
jgi:hypothetical protein